MRAPDPEHLASVPSWARKAIDATIGETPPQSPGVLAHRTLPEWPLFVDAALVSGFLPRDLAPDVVDVAFRGEAERHVLQFSEPLHTPDGLRWALTPDARQAVIGATINSTEIDIAANRTESRFPEPTNAALRDCLIGKSTEQFPTRNLKSLEALRAAVNTLRGIQGLKLPDLDELDRRIELGRLIGQFERMTGVLQSDDATSVPEDRFFGRDAQLEQLRSYVDVVRADSLGGRAKRVVDRARRHWEGRPPLNVWGIGGVGKTTLMAKFMLEHVRLASSRFPFAYLDFDRATVSARNRPGLLIDMCRQVGAQFPDLMNAMNSMREQLRELVRRIEVSPSGESIDLLRPYLRAFRTAMDKYFDEQESRFERRRPFLVVFDTFEIVEHTAGDITRLEEFVRGFSPTNAAVWPRLRLVISGRHPVKAFLGKIEPLRLGGLDREGAAQMVEVLAGDARRPITSKRAETLVEAIIRRVGDRRDSLHPLRLRLVGEQFKKKGEESGAAIVDSLLEELRKPLSASGHSGSQFVDGILIRRILNVVTDDRVRALADPGLVVRRITPEVIRYVMTRGTVRPDADGKDPAVDVESTEWTVDEKEAEEIFGALRAEVTLVEPEGNALRHRQDLREEMLPLIRARHEDRYFALHQLAYDYFKQQVQEDARDHTSAAEAIYHGLWLERPLTEIDQLWPAEATFDPRIIPNEFSEDSVVAAYLRAKATQRLDATDVRRLPPAIALSWLVSYCRYALDDPLINQVVDTMQAIAGHGFEALQKVKNPLAPTATVGRLLCRAGRWQVGVELLGRECTERTKCFDGSSQLDASLQDATSMLRTYVTMLAKGGAPAHALERALGNTQQVRDSLALVELYAHAGIAGINNGGDEGLSSHAVNLGYHITEVRASQWQEQPRVLRLAILMSRDVPQNLLGLYFDGLSRLPRDAPAKSALVVVLLALFGPRQPLGNGQKLSAALRKWPDEDDAAEAIQQLFREQHGRLVEAAYERLDLKNDLKRIVSYDHRDWEYVFTNSLERGLDGPRSRGLFHAIERQSALSQNWGHGEVPTAVAIVEAAMDRGNFVTLAETVQAARSLTRNSREIDEMPQYPEDVFGIAAAFLEWNRKIKTLLEDDNINGGSAKA